MSTCRFLTWAVGCFVLGAVATSAAQTATNEPPPPWDTQVGASFVETSGNTDAATLGADFEFHRRWPVWQIESTATALRVTSDDVRTAERYIGTFRGQRAITSALGLTAGEQAERDRPAGVDLRSILDLGLSWAIVRTGQWTLDATTAAAWNHERPIAGPDLDHPIGMLQAVNWISVGPSADTTQRFTFYPDFEDSSAYRMEAEVAAEAEMNGHLALKLGYLWRDSNEPVAGFKKIDSTVTASLVLHWRAAKPVPKQ